MIEKKGQEGGREELQKNERSNMFATDNFVDTFNIQETYFIPCSTVTSDINQPGLNIFNSSFLTLK